MFSMWAQRFHGSKAEIDTGQRWLVRPTAATFKRGKTSPEYPPLPNAVFELNIGEVSGTGKYFRIHEAYASYKGWYSFDDFEWLEQLI